jgi:hypothetical protein
MTFPLETIPPRDPTGGVVYLRIILSPEEASCMYDISVFGKRPSRKNDNVVVFPMAVHATGICYSYYNITYQLAMDVRIVWSGFELET